MDLAGRRVLVVEDEWLLASDTARALQQAGAIVVGAVANLQDALSLVGEAGPFDAALLDIKLGAEMAYPVADRLREMAVPFAFVSGYAPGVRPARFEDVPFHEKPFDACAATRQLLAGP